jgi:hypothetical protein
MDVTMTLARRSFLSLALLSLGCASAPRPPPDASLWRGSRLTVLVFFSSHCPCQKAHDWRLIELHRRYGERGVRFVLVDSEAGASAERSADEARRRGYPFSIRPDPEGHLADAFEARYATFTVIVDEAGAVRYRGGIDSDRKDLHDDARHYVASALDDLLEGREPRVAEGKSLGCALQRR